MTMLHSEVWATPSCGATDVALKSFFLGPQSENSEWLLDQLMEIFGSWFRWRRQSFHEDGSAISGADQGQPEFKLRQQRVQTLIEALSSRFKAELPKFSPRYVGHMLSEISVPALLGHILTLLHNPNIIAREAATVGADMENEALEPLGRMLGFTQAFGHFTSGGTVANFEAVVRASARCHTWMALEALRRRQGLSDLTLFQAAHMGWESYQCWREGFTDQELAAFLPERADPWEAIRGLEEAYGIRYRGPALIVPRTAHYSWKKAARLFGVGEANLIHVDASPAGRYLVGDLKARILECQQRNQPILAVVSVTGTTETGAIDPVDEIQDLLDELKARQGLHIWHHVDAAYGGFLCTILRHETKPPAWVTEVLAPPVMRALDAIGRTDSVTIDPHKLGYVPYSSGTFLTADERDYTCVQTLAPYLDFHPRSDRGPYTLEGSRSAAGAVATWLTSRSIGLHSSGYGLLLARTVRQKLKLERYLQEKLPSAYIYPGCDSNLLCLCVADLAEAVSATNARTLRIIQRLAGQRLYFLSKTAFALTGPSSAVPLSFVARWSGPVDCDHLLVVRICLMNPFFDSTELDVDHVQRLVFSMCEVAD